MKTTIVLIVALFAMSFPAQAQKKIFVRDSVSCPLGPSAAAQVIRTAQGYGIARYIKNARNASAAVAGYSPVLLTVTFANVMDSAKVQGLMNTGTSTDETDSTYVDLWVKPVQLQPKTGRYTTGAQIVPVSLADTSVRWLSPVTTDQMTFTFDMSAFNFAKYRVVTGSVDSGKTRLTYTIKED